MMTIVRLNDDYENEFMIRSCGFSSTQVLLEVPGRGNSGYFAVAIKSTEVRIIPHICLFFTQAKFLENKIYILQFEYNLNCQFFALNL